MTQLSYYGSPGPTVPHRGGLIAWGSVMIASGALFSCGGIFGMIAIVFMSTQNPGGGGGGSSPAMLRGFSTMLVAIGTYGALIWLGIGCCLGRRWARPLVLIGSVITLAFGILSIVPLTFAAGKIITNAMKAPATTAPAVAPGGTPPAAFAAIGGIIGVVMMFAIAIVVPAFSFYFFRQDTVRQSLEMTDPKPRWTDKVPLPLLGWVVYSAIAGFGNIFTGLNGVCPIFNAIITGPMASVVMALIGLLLIIGGWLSYRRSSIGWTLSIAVMAFTAVSMGTFTLFGDSEQYQHMILSGFGPAVQQGAKQGMYSASNLSPTLIPALMSMAAVGYGIWLRPRVTAK